MVRRVLVLLSLWLAPWFGVLGDEAPAPAVALSPLERLGQLMPSPAELLAAPTGFRSTTPRASAIAIAEATATIERNARTRGTAENLHALAILELVRGSCALAGDLLQVALAEREHPAWRRDLAIAVLCADATPDAAVRAFEEVLRATPPEARSGDELVARLENQLGLTERVARLERSDYGARVAWALGPGLFAWAQARDDQPERASALRAELVATAAEALARGDRSLADLPAHLELPGFAAAARAFEPMHLEYQRGGCSWVSELEALPELPSGLPSGLELRAALMAAGCDLQRDRAHATASIISVLEAARALGLHWLELRASWALAVAVAQSGDSDGAAEHFRDALEIATRLDDQEARLGLTTELARRHDPESPAALAAVPFLLEAAGSQTSARGRLAALFLASDLAAGQGFVWVAHAIAKLGEQIGRELSGAPRAEVLAWLARTEAAAGLFDAADLNAHAGLLALRDTNDPAARAIEARLRLSRARIAIGRDESELALSELRLAEHILDEHGQRAGAAAAAAERGLLLARIGRPDEAIAALDRASESAPDEVTRDLARRALALILVDQGRSAEAWTLLSGDPGHRPLLGVRRLANDEVVLFELSAEAVRATTIGTVSTVRELAGALRASLASSVQSEVATNLVAGFRRRLFPDGRLISGDRELYVDLPRGLWGLPVELAAPDLPLAFVVARDVGEPAAITPRPSGPIEILLGSGHGEDLPQAEREAAAVAAIWGDGAPMNRTDDPWRVMLGSKAAIVHVIAHGPLPENLRTPKPVSPRLAILNGCQTLGEHEPSPLVRDLTSAGTSVVGTVVDVDDDLAHELALALHAELAAGAPPATALRDATTSLSARDPDRGLLARSSWRALVGPTGENAVARPSISRKPGALGHQSSPRKELP